MHLKVYLFMTSSVLSFDTRGRKQVSNVWIYDTFFFLLSSLKKKKIERRTVREKKEGETNSEFSPCLYKKIHLYCLRRIFFTLRSHLEFSAHRFVFFFRFQSVETARRRQQRYFRRGPGGDEPAAHQGPQSVPAGLGPLRRHQRHRQRERCRVAAQQQAR